MRITLSDVTKHFGDKCPANGINYDFSQNGVYLLTGKSGSGKSTLLKMIAGLIPADSGKITRDSGISFAFQEDRLFPWLNVEKNVGVCGDKQTADRFLERLSLSDSKDKFPDELSGGMCRRVSLVRAFSYGGVPLLLDEPFRGLDNELKETVRNIIMELGENRIVICATHEKELFSKVNDILTLENGNLI